MKFTPTSLFLSICKGASKYLQWKVYVKKTTDLSEALTVGTWIEVTERTEIPTINMNIEVSVGSSSSDKITLEGSGITWWQAQIFNATSSQYIEVKIICQLGLSETKLATDLCYEFYGYAEKKYTIQESSDTIRFEVFTADDFLGILPAENLSKQVKVSNLDGAGLEGIYLQSIPGVYIVDANITSYVLHQGVHDISFGYRSGVVELSLDGGTAIIPAAGLNILANEDDTQRVQVYCKLTEFLSSGDVKTEIIVKTSGETLPWTWLSGIRVKDALAQIYALIGLTDFTFDEWDLNTFDGRRVTSFFEVPPSGTYYGRTNCVAYEDSNATFYLGVKDRLYTRNMSTHAYTLLCTPLATWEIKKIFTDRLVADGYIWLLLKSGANNKIARVTISNWSVTTYSIMAVYEQAVCYANAIGTNGSLLYWTTSENYIKKFDLATNTESDFYGSPFTVINAVLTGSGGCTDGTNYYATAWKSGTPNEEYLVKFTTSGEVILDFAALAYELAYVADDILMSLPTVNTGVWKYDISLDTWTQVSTGLVLCAFTRTSTIHCVIKDADGSAHIAKYTSATLIKETESIQFATDTIDVGQLMTYDSANNKNLFVSYVSSMLGQFYTKVSVFLSPEISFAGESLRGALNTILESYMMLGKISPTKKVYVYRRFNASGIPVSSGNSFAVTINEAEDIIKQVRYSEAVKWLEISNGSETHSYDGTNWDEQLFTSDRKLTINSKLIPSNIVKDICYYLWQFFCADHHLYEIPLANVTPLHLEAFDGLAVTFTANRITESGTLVIYGISVEQDGYVKVKGLK